MSNDPLMDHLENMSGMNGSRHWNQPYCYATTDSQDAEAERLDEERRRVEMGNMSEALRLGLVRR